MGIVLFVVCIIALFVGQNSRNGREKKVYVTLCTLAALLWFAAFFKEQGDHVGASLSGMISIFMR